MNRTGLLAGGAAFAVAVIAVVVFMIFGGRKTEAPAVVATGTSGEPSDIRIDFGGPKVAGDPLAIDSEPADDTVGEPVTLTAQPMLFVSGKADVGKGSSIDALDKAYANIKSYMTAQGLSASGARIAVTVNFDQATNIWSYRAGIPLAVAPASPPGAGDAIVLGQSFGGQALRFLHVGDPNDAERTYEKINQWMAMNGFVPAGPSWEEYLSDPSTPIDQWRTNIYYPI